MAGGEHESQKIVADLIVDRGIEIRTGHLSPGLDLVTELLVLALDSLLSANFVDRTVLRGGRARRPGLSGTPDSGHCSSATTSASCASSSARPTSRTIRARPAMSRAHSILKTALIAR
jgi:hypothetical protein